VRTCDGSSDGDDGVCGVWCAVAVVRGPTRFRPRASTPGAGSQCAVRIAWHYQLLSAISASSATPLSNATSVGHMPYAVCVFRIPHSR
jgi:hypothetical protein